MQRFARYRMKHARGGEISLQRLSCAATGLSFPMAFGPCYMIDIRPERVYYTCIWAYMHTKGANSEQLDQVDGDDTR